MPTSSKMMFQTSDIFKKPSEICPRKQICCSRWCPSLLRESLVLGNPSIFGIVPGLGRAQVFSRVLYGHLSANHGRKFAKSKLAETTKLGCVYIYICIYIYVYIYMYIYIYVYIYMYKEIILCRICIYDYRCKSFICICMGMPLCSENSRVPDVGQPQPDHASARHFEDFGELLTMKGDFAHYFIEISTFLYIWVLTCTGHPGNHLHMRASVSGVRWLPREISICSHS